MKRLTIVVAYLSLFWLITGKAGIMANMTRVIYHQGDKERSVLLANTNSYPVIVQNWVDHGEADPQTETPFVVLASIFHLPAQKVQAIRIIYNGDQRPLCQPQGFQPPFQIQRSVDGSDAVGLIAFALFECHVLSSPVIIDNIYH